MDAFDQTHLQKLLVDTKEPCVSIFTPTHPGGDEQGRIRARRQLDEAADKLRDRGVRDAAAWLEPARARLASDEFWKHASNGLATFISKNGCETHRLPLRFDERVVVGAHFHIKPLLPWIGEEGRFYVLAISQNHIRLLEGTAHGVRALPLPGAPQNEKEALRTHDRDDVLNFHTHHGAMGNRMQAVFHGQGVGIDDHKTELAQYMQKIDRAVCHALGGSRFPLILATDDYLAAIYRAHSKYPRLLDACLPGNPDHLSNQDLHAKALPVVLPLFHGREERLVAQYPRLKTAGRTMDGLSEALPAAQRGELETLLLAPGRDAWGVFDPAAAFLEEHVQPRPHDEELTNLAAIFMLRHHRHVIALHGKPPFGAAPLAGILFVAKSSYAAQ